MPEHLVRIYQDSLTYELDGKTVEEAIEVLRKKEQSILQRYKDTTIVKLTYEQEPYEDYYNIYMGAYRPENEKERKTREDRERREEEQREKWQREQFERLKEKFGDA